MTSGLIHIIGSVVLFKNFFTEFYGILDIWKFLCHSPAPRPSRPKFLDKPKISVPKASLNDLPPVFSHIFAPTTSFRPLLSLGEVIQYQFLRKVSPAPNSFTIPGCCFHIFPFLFPLLPKEIQDPCYPLSSDPFLQLLLLLSLSFSLAVSFLSSSRPETS